MKTVSSLHDSIKEIAWKSSIGVNIPVGATDIPYLFRFYVVDS